MQITIKNPTAIYTSGVRRFVGIPVILAPESQRSLESALGEVVSEQAGLGRRVSEQDGVSVFDLVVTNDSRILGDWIVRYSLSDSDGAGVVGFWVAAEVA